MSEKDQFLKNRLLEIRQERLDTLRANENKHCALVECKKQEKALREQLQSLQTHLEELRRDIKENTSKIKLSQEEENLIQAEHLSSCDVDDCQRVFHFWNDFSDSIPVGFPALFAESAAAAAPALFAESVAAASTFTVLSVSAPTESVPAQAESFPAVSAPTTSTFGNVTSAAAAASAFFSDASTTSSDKLDDEGGAEEEEKEKEEEKQEEKQEEKANDSPKCNKCGDAMTDPDYKNCAKCREVERIRKAQSRATTANVEATAKTAATATANLQARERVVAEIGKSGADGKNVFDSEFLTSKREEKRKRLRKRKARADLLQEEDENAEPLADEPAAEKHLQKMQKKTDTNADSDLHSEKTSAERYAERKRLYTWIYKDHSLPMQEIKDTFELLEKHAIEQQNAKSNPHQCFANYYWAISKSGCNLTEAEVKKLHDDFFLHGVDLKEKVRLLPPDAVDSIFGYVVVKNHGKDFLRDFEQTFRVHSAKIDELRCTSERAYDERVKKRLEKKATAAALSRASALGNSVEI